MAAPQPTNHALDQIKTAAGLAGGEISESIELTPVMVLAASLLYMMSSDGHIEDEESSQLQAVIGGNEELLSYALAYVQRVPVDDFLKLAPVLLSQQDKLCILTNVCDSMLSDGRCETAELALFEKMQTAFGVTASAFKPYFKIIQLKNDKSVFGPFVPLQEGTQRVTPHLALAASLIYMMSADGNLGQEEIGQLETVIGEFDGLQKAALTYVRSVKREDFFKQARPVLSSNQLLCILSNVCDSMMADGVVAVVEDKLFLRMVMAFGLREEDFDRYQKVLETKNFKPFDVSKFQNRTVHGRELTDELVEGEMLESAQPESALGIEVRRTMHDNIEGVHQDLGSDENIIQVNHNAIDDLNLQILPANSAIENLQVLDRSLAPQVNKQPLTKEAQSSTPKWLGGQATIFNRAALDIEAASVSRIQIEVAAPEPNVQTLEPVPEVNNTQVLPQESSVDHFEVLPPEVRVKNLFEGIEDLTEQLDQFEVENKNLLAAGKELRLLEEKTRSEAAAKHQDNFGSLTLGSDENALGLDKQHELTNMQFVGAEVFGANHQKIWEGEAPANWQMLPTHTPPNDLDVSRSAANSAFLADAAFQTNPASHTQPYAGHEEAGLLAANDPGGERRSSASGRLVSRDLSQKDELSRRRDLKILVKVSATFLMLSLWSTNIAAVYPKNFSAVVGKLNRLGQTPINAAPINAAPVTIKSR